MLKKRLPLDVPKRKNYMELSRGSEVIMRTQHATQRDDRQIFVLNTECLNW